MIGQHGGRERLLRVEKFRGTSQCTVQYGSWLCSVRVEGLCVPLLILDTREWGHEVAFVVDLLSGAY